MSSSLMPFIWVGITIPILVILQRWIHRHLHGVALLVTGNKNWAVVLYAIVLFPGVLLHEVSHWLVAKLLGVKTASFSIIPKSNADGTIRLGYVEYYKTRSLGPIRESLIGSAPLITGSAAVLLIAVTVFEIPSLVTAIQFEDQNSLAEALTALFGTSDFFIWLYLIFAISNAMMPSASDRRAWPAFALVMLVFAVVLYIFGLQDEIARRLLDPATTVFGYLGLAYSLVIGVDLFFVLGIHIIEWLISRIKGVDVVYGRPDQS